MRQEMIRTCFIVALLLVASEPARAQRPGMPDLSNAPADIRAIWKKVQSGGIPSPDEAQKLGQYLAAHAGDIQRAARKTADSVKVAAPKQAALALGPAADPSKACPARSPALSTVASSAPSSTAAQAFLDTITRAFLAREKPAAAQRLQTGIAKIKDADRLEMTGAMFYLAGFDGAAIVTYADAARRGGSGAQRRWTNLGAMLVSYGDDANAITALRRAIALGEPYPLLVHQLGVAYADLGELAVAESLLTRATAMSPKFGLSWDALARVQSCGGNMSAAWRSLAQAQAVDWNDRRQRLLDKHDPESNDDRLEAQKPFIEPNGPSFFVSASAPPPADFAAETPVIPDTWTENLGHPMQFLKTANAYRTLVDNILRQEQTDEAAGSRAMDAAARRSGASAHGFILSIALQNGREAISAMERERYRLSAKEAMLLRAHADKDSVIMQQVLADQTNRDDQLHACQKAAGNNDKAYYACDIPYCKAKLSALEKHYAEFRDNARVYIGGMTGLGGQYDRVMRQWYMSAGDPSVQVGLDAERRYQLAGMAVTMFTVASGVGPNDIPSEKCFDPREIAALEALAAAEAAKANPGPCSSFDKTIPFIVTIQGDCKHLRMTLDLDLDLPATPTLEYQAASHGHSGKIFIGGGQDALHGLVSGEAGLALTFNEGGWVQGFGPAATVNVGNDMVATGTASGMVNLLDHGPAGEASVGFNGFGYQASIATDTGFSGNFQ